MKLSLIIPFFSVLGAVWFMSVINFFKGGSGGPSGQINATLQLVLISAVFVVCIIMVFLA